MTPRPAVPPYAPPETAVLTPAQTAQWLQVSERQLERIEGFPWVTVGGPRSRRVAVRDVLRWIEKQSQGKVG
jgi:hypothetical protein